MDGEIRMYKNKNHMALEDTVIRCRQGKISAIRRYVFSVRCSRDSRKDDDSL